MWYKGRVHISNLQLLINHSTEADQIYTFPLTDTEIVHQLFFFITLISGDSQDQMEFQCVTVKVLSYLQLLIIIDHSTETNQIYTFSSYSGYYPLANEVVKGYSNATVRLSFRNILVNTLELTSFNVC